MDFHQNRSCTCLDLLQTYVEIGPSDDPDLPQLKKSLQTLPPGVPRPRNLLAPPPRPFNIAVDYRDGRVLR